MMSVSMEPGHTELAVIPYCPSSRAHVRAMPSSAALEPE